MTDRLVLVVGLVSVACLATAALLLTPSSSETERAALLAVLGIGATSMAAALRSNAAAKDASTAAKEATKAATGVNGGLEDRIEDVVRRVQADRRWSDPRDEQ